MRFLLHNTTHRYFKKKSDNIREPATRTTARNGKSPDGTLQPSGRVTERYVFDDTGRSDLAETTTIRADAVDRVLAGIVRHLCQLGHNFAGRLLGSRQQNDAAGRRRLYRCSVAGTADPNRAGLALRRHGCGVWHGAVGTAERTPR